MSLLKPQTAPADTLELVRAYLGTMPPYTYGAVDFGRDRAGEFDIFRYFQIAEAGIDSTSQSVLVRRSVSHGSVALLNHKDSVVALAAIENHAVTQLRFGPFIDDLVLALGKAAAEALSGIFEPRLLHVSWLGASLLWLASINDSEPDRYLPIGAAQAILPEPHYSATELDLALSKELQAMRAATALGPAGIQAFSA